MRLESSWKLWKTKPIFFAPQQGEAVLRHRLDRRAVDPDLAGGGAVEAGHQGEQGRLAAARGAEDGDELAGIDRDVDVVEDRQLPLPRRELAGELAHFDAGRIHMEGEEICGRISGFSEWREEGRFYVAKSRNSRSDIGYSRGTSRAVGLRRAGSRGRSPGDAQGGYCFQSGAGGPAGDAPAPVPATPLVVFLGDSLTAGLGLDENQAYPALLGRQLREEGKAVRVVNAGVSGDTTAGGLARIGWILGQHPDLVVVGLGANDGLRGLPLAEVETNLREIIRRSREAGARVLLLGMRLPPNYGPYAEQFTALYPKLAKELNVPLVPFLLDKVGGIRSLNQADGIHPHGQGAGDRGEERAAVSGGDAGGAEGRERDLRDSRDNKDQTRTRTCSSLVVLVRPVFFC